MFSVKANYEKGKITLDEPLHLDNKADVIITFLDGEIPTDSASGDDQYFEGVRAHKRYKAKGQITVLEDGIETSFELNDYSAGGLSFFCNKGFGIGEHITATIKYNAAGELLVMEFTMEVRNSIDKEEHYMIGCQFLDSVDEELWHTIMS